MCMCVCVCVCVCVCDIVLSLCVCVCAYLSVNSDELLWISFGPWWQNHITQRGRHTHTHTKTALCHTHTHTHTHTQTHTHIKPHRQREGAYVQHMYGQTPIIYTSYPSHR